MKGEARVPAITSLLALLSATGCDDALPPFAEVVVIADTDLPVPLAVSRLRIDVFDQNGNWLATADVARPDPRDWPVSFSVHADDRSDTRRAWVRLRAYGDGKTRDYRGDNPFSWGGPIEPGEPAANAPRLIRDGQDITPPSEPDPINAVDRVVLLKVHEEQVDGLPVLLAGECLGTSVLLGSAGPQRGSTASCTDRFAERQLVEPVEGLPGVLGIPMTAAGTWLSEPVCPEPDETSERVCIPGGATVMGATDPTSNAVLSAQPVRVVGVRRFYMDRREVTVMRARAAIAAGFVPVRGPYANDGPLEPTPTGYCTWSTEPMAREEYSLNCLTWSDARGFCQFWGGDLPTEVQWEHAASVAGRSAKTRYPWGNELPDCDRAAYGRSGSPPNDSCAATKGLLTPAPHESDQDRTPLGVIGLGGGLAEWVLDESSTYADSCWGDAPIVDPRCGDPEGLANRRILRGVSFLSEATPCTIRYDQDPGNGFGPVGFRCVYPDAS